MQHDETHDIQRGLLLQEDETHEEGQSTDLCPNHDLRPNFRNPHAVSGPYRNIGTSVWNAVSTQLPQGIRPKNTITEQIENLKGQQETLPVDVRYYSFAGAVEGRADGL